MRKACFIFALSMFAWPVCAQQRYCVENDNTHAFLTEFSYDSLDLSVSYIMRYFNMPHEGVRLDAPMPVRLSWTRQDGAEAQRVEVSESSAYSDSIVCKIDKDTAEYDLYNLIPGKLYYYRIVSVKDGIETTVGTGQLEPTGMLRWILAEGTWNVRDMGGWPGLDGYPIKYGKLFRGGQLTNPKSPYNILINEKGIEAMRNAGIRAELDLRSSSQAHYSTPSFADNGYAADFNNIATTSARMWKYDNDNSNIRAIQWVIDELKAGKPVFYHCQNGADRTGTIGLLIGALLGMSDSDLAKDYELTTFCQAAAVKFDATEAGFARLRNYEGKKGSTDSSSDPKDYMFAPVIDKLNGIAGASTQEKIYNFFKNGVNGTKISEADLDWFINYMLSPVEIFSPMTLDINSGETSQIDARIVSFRDGLPNPVISYSSADPNVATVSQEGVITGVRGGTTVITAELDGYVQTVNVVVEKEESKLPASVHYDGKGYLMKGKNLIKNGSFEYADSLSEWKNGTTPVLSADNFSVKNYEDGTSKRYLESKGDGDESSANSISMAWRISSRKTYVFGYSVKNSTDVQTTGNENLKVTLTKSSGSLDLEGYPSYDGNWTDVQYVFTNSNSYSKLQIDFTHLSQNGNNTCFDNFYLAEIEYSAGVGAVRFDINDGNVYDLNGRKVGQAVDGIIIKDGKKVLVK